MNSISVSDAEPGDRAGFNCCYEPSGLWNKDMPVFVSAR